MLEKIELRLKLKAISMVNSEYDTSVLTKLNDIIKNKTICTYIPLQNEININGYLSTHSLLTTTCVVNEEIKICKYEEPLEKNKYNVYQPKKLKIVDSADIFLVPGIGFDINGRRLGRGGGIYDQLLSKFPNSIFLGVTDRNHLVECIPHEIHDISMDGLITHDEFIEINI
jgi:5,10-methenyltetrahydrofolate synthetase